MTFVRFGSYADMTPPLGQVRFAPKADNWTDVSASPLCAGKRHMHRSKTAPPLFDHLVGAGEQHRWDCQADFSCRFQIDDELEPGRLLDGR